MKRYIYIRYENGFCEKPQFFDSFKSARRAMQDDFLRVLGYQKAEGYTSMVEYYKEVDGIDLTEDGVMIDCDDELGMDWASSFDYNWDAKIYAINEDGSVQDVDKNVLESEEGLIVMHDSIIPEPHGRA